MHLFNDRGTPASLRHINAYSGHTYKFTKEVKTFFSPALLTYNLFHARGVCVYVFI